MGYRTLMCDWPRGIGKGEPNARGIAWFLGCRKASRLQTNKIKEEKPCVSNSQLDSQR